MWTVNHPQEIGAGYNVNQRRKDVKVNLGVAGFSNFVFPGLSTAMFWHSLFSYNLVFGMLQNFLTNWNLKLYSLDNFRDDCPKAAFTTDSSFLRSHQSFPKFSSGIKQGINMILYLLFSCLQIRIWCRFQPVCFYSVVASNTMSDHL